MMCLKMRLKSNIVQKFILMGAMAKCSPPPKKKKYATAYTLKLIIACVTYRFIARTPRNRNAPDNLKSTLWYIIKAVRVR